MPSLFSEEEMRERFACEERLTAAVAAATKFLESAKYLLNANARAGEDADARAFMTGGHKEASAQQRHALGLFKMAIQDLEALPLLICKHSKKPVPEWDDFTVPAGQLKLVEREDSDEDEFPEVW